MRALALLQGLPLEVYPANSRRLGSVMALAREHQLSAYDATYLATALEEGFPLATLDERIRHSGTVAGLRVLP